jgi:hypothetical protein
MLIALIVGTILAAVLFPRFVRSVHAMENERELFRTSL